MVITGNTAKYDQWRRLRELNGFSDLFNSESYSNGESSFAFYGKGRLIYIPKLINPSTELVSEKVEQELGFATKWRKPINMSEFKSVVLWAVNKKLPLMVNAPEWIGVSHDKNGKDDIVHLFSYKPEEKTVGISLVISGQVKNVTVLSPDKNEDVVVPFFQIKDDCFIQIPELEVYNVLKIER